MSLVPSFHIGSGVDDLSQSLRNSLQTMHESAQEPINSFFVAIRVVMANEVRAVSSISCAFVVGLLP